MRSATVLSGTIRLLLAGLSVVLLVAGLVAWTPASSAQTPTPTPAATATPVFSPPLIVPPAPPDATPLTSPCDTPSAGKSLAGATLQAPGWRWVMPSTGDHAYFLVPTGNGSGTLVAICHVPTHSTVWLDPFSGKEVRRSASAPAGSAALDAIVAAIRPGSPGPCLADCGPGAPPVLNICSTAARALMGGFNFVSPTGTLNLILVGDYKFSIPGEIPGNDGISICDVASGSTVQISIATGVETGRSLGPGPGGATALDRIVAALRFTPGPPGAALSPPRTGDGGLVLSAR